MKYVIGQKYGKLILKSVYRKDKRTIGMCDCECGTINYETRTCELVSGHIKSCGCLKLISPPSQIGDNYNFLTIKEIFTKNNRKYAICDCNCGSEDICVNLLSLRSGHCKSYGCTRKNNKEWYEERKAKRLCISCDKPAVSNRVSCQRCLEANKIKSKTKRDKHNKDGLCSDCANPAVVGKKLCQTCLDKDKVRTKVKLKSRKEKGICARCKNPAVPGLAHCENCLNKAKEQARKDKQTILDHYGQVCNCRKCNCLVTVSEHLTIDHVNNNGNQHRETMTSSGIYKWIIKNNFPNEIQILCWNCNCSKHHHGHCGKQPDMLRQPSDFMLWL